MYPTQQVAFCVITTKTPTTPPLGLGPKHQRMALGTGSNGRQVLHVQSISSWAPSCIGPYSQASMLGGLLHMAGQIGLDPPTMQLVPGGLQAQLLRYGQ